MTPQPTRDTQILDRAILETFGELVNASNGEVVSSEAAGPLADQVKSKLFSMKVSAN